MLLLIVDGGIYPCTSRVAQEARHALGFISLEGASSFDEHLVRGVLHPSSNPEARSCFRDWIIGGQEVLPKQMSIGQRLTTVLAAAACGAIAWGGGAAVASSTGLWLVVMAVYLAAALALPAGWLVIAAQSAARRFLLRRFYRRNRGAPRLCPSEAFLELGNMSDLAHVPPGEFECFLLESREALELLGRASSGKTELPELERQALLAKVRSSLRRRVIAAEATRKARQELDRDSYLREVHAALGWSPEEAELRRELDSLQ